MKRINVISIGCLLLGAIVVALLNQPIDETAPPASSTREPARPGADQILEMARLNQRPPKHGLSARLVKGKTTIPMGMARRKEAIHFKFKEPDEILELKIERKGAILNREVRAGRTAIPKADYGERFRGTDMTIEDLSMLFLYWPKPVFLKEDQIGKAKNRCWVLQIMNPDRTGHYQKVHIWVHQATGTLVQAEGFGWKSPAKPMRRFRVTQMMEVDGSWILENMVIETLDPANGRRLGDTKLQVRSPSKARPAEQDDVQSAAVFESKPRGQLQPSI